MPESLTIDPTSPTVRAPITPTRSGDRSGSTRRPPRATTSMYSPNNGDERHEQRPHRAGEHVQVAGPLAGDRAPERGPPSLGRVEHELREVRTDIGRAQEVEPERAAEDGRGGGRGDQQHPATDPPAAQRIEDQREDGDQADDAAHVRPEPRRAVGQHHHPHQPGGPEHGRPCPPLAVHVDHRGDHRARRQHGEAGVAESGVPTTGLGGVAQHAPPLQVGPGGHIDHQHHHRCPGDAAERGQRMAVALRDAPPTPRRARRAQVTRLVTVPNSISGGTARMRNVASGHAANVSTTRRTTAELHPGMRSVSSRPMMIT